MKNFPKFFIVLAIIFLHNNVYSQVAQIYQVLEYPSKKPLQGVTSTLYGQNLRTDANGIAVVTLTSDKKGKFMPLKNWQSPDYHCLGRTEECFNKYLQSDDTLKYYMVDKKQYWDETNKIYETLFNKWYANEYLALARHYIDTIKKCKTDNYNLVEEYIQYSFAESYAQNGCATDAEALNPFANFEYDKPYLKNVLDTLYSGNIEKAIETVEDKIDKNGNSALEDQWIELYRTLRYLKYPVDKEYNKNLSEYTEVLYNNRKNIGSAVKYIYDLLNDHKIDKAVETIKAVKAENDNPLFASILMPDFLRCMYSSEKTCLKASADEFFNIESNNYIQYPCEISSDNLLNAYLNSVYAYTILDDSVKTYQLFDSAFNIIVARGSQMQDKYEKNSFVINELSKFLTFVDNERKYIRESTLNKYIETAFDAAYDNFTDNPDELLSSVELAETGTRLIVMSTDNDFISNAMEKVYEANERLSKRYPELYSVRNVRLAQQIIVSQILTEAAPENLSRAFDKYENSFNSINTLLPHSFTDKYLQFNASLESYLTSYQNYALSSELNEFSDKLLGEKSEKKEKDIHQIKANYYNMVAENLYNSKVYDAAVLYYLKSNAQFDSVANGGDETLKEHLTNYLQMGDAHLYQNQFDKALLTYRKIFEFENSVPKSQKAMYSTMKASAHYYIGDAYKMQNMMKDAEKEYKLAEKEYKKAYSLGDKSAYKALGELYFGKAQLAIQNQDLKKGRQYVDLSVKHYESDVFERAYNTYERAKRTQIAFCKLDDDSVAYYRNLAGLTDYYRQFLLDNTDYAQQLYSTANEMLNINADSKNNLQYAKDILNSLLVLNENGMDVDKEYLRGMFILGNNYIENDSVEEAINVFKDCINMNTFMFKDTAENTWKSNLLHIYSRLAICYDQMADHVDTAHSEVWNYRTVDVRDTIIDILSELAVRGDEYSRYQAAGFMRENAMTYYDLNSTNLAISYLDKSNEMLMPLYYSEYKSDVEEDIMKNHFYKGVIYSEKNNTEMAVKSYRSALEIGDKTDELSNIILIYTTTVESLIEELKKDYDANTSEIKQLQSTLKSLQKRIK